MKGKDEMAEEHKVKVIARLRSDFPEKFGIPRQSGLLERMESLVVFEPEFRNADALRGIEGFSHLWLVWQFSEAVREEWRPTVRPPRLGGNARMGVFATRSPFRPNPIGLSSVRLLGVEETKERGIVLRVSGADMMDGTPIYDIKPYLAYTDSHPDATGGFVENLDTRLLRVVFPEELLGRLPTDKRETLVAVLENDPRPRYQNDPLRVYKMSFAGMRICFRVSEEELTVTEVQPL